MYGLPKSTEVKRNLPKAQLYKQFDLKPAQRDGFDAAVARLDFVNWISPKTVPAIAQGNEVKEIFVVEVEMKNSDYDPKKITLVAKLIPQRIVFVLRFGADAQFAIYHDKLFTAQRASIDDVSLPLSGLNLDSVWTNLVSHIGQFSVENENTLSEQIKADTERAKILRQIAQLELKMRSTTQTRRQREIYSEIKRLKGGLNG